eukprot:361021-Alexandrium_andersonii.AAC.1
MDGGSGGVLDGDGDVGDSGDGNGDLTCPEGPHANRPPRAHSASMQQLEHGHVKGVGLAHGSSRDVSVQARIHQHAARQDYAWR